MVRLQRVVIDFRPREEVNRRATGRTCWRIAVNERTLSDLAGRFHPCTVGLVRRAF
jgi:hypothetical protein